MCAAPPSPPPPFISVHPTPTSLRRHSRHKPTLLARTTPVSSTPHAPPLCHVDSGEELSHDWVLDVVLDQMVYALETHGPDAPLKELLLQRPPSVSDDELQFLLRQSPEECLEARLGIAEAAEHEADVGERARLVFLARVAELLAGSIVVD